MWTNSAGATVSLLYLMVMHSHAFWVSTVSMPGWRVCKMGNEWDRKLYWIQYMQPIQIPSKPLKTIASVNTPDGPMCAKKSQLLLLLCNWHSRETENHPLSIYIPASNCKSSKQRHALCTDAHTKDACFFASFLHKHIHKHEVNIHTNTQMQCLCVGTK